MTSGQWIARRFAVGTAMLVYAQTVAAQGDSAPPAQTQAAPTVEERLQELDQKIRILQRLRELEQEDAAKKKKETPVLVAGKDGFLFRSPDTTFQFRLRGYIQEDGRFFLADEERPATDAFLLRRVRPIFEGTVWKYVDFRFMPDFAGGTAILFDGYADLRLRPEFVLRAGKYKPPVGLERLQSATDILFVERGLPTNLVPNRDIGLELTGDIKQGVLSYAAGVFNGTVDLGNTDVDNGNDKDVAARIFVQPFKAAGPRSSLSGLGFGIAGSRGIQQGSLTTPFLPSYRSPGQQTVFAYRADATAAGTVFANGFHNRLSPQGYFYVGPLGVLTEYTVSSQLVRRADTATRLNHRAWQVASSWVLTGEKPSFKGVAPKQAFDPRERGWGALEIGARYGQLLIDRDAFPVFANPESSVREADAWGVALNWYLARGIRMQVNYEQTSFDGGAPGGANRETERAILARVQQSF